ncbi:MAG: Uma2 family endonuclease [Methylococcales bacterium]
MSSIPKPRLSAEDYLAIEAANTYKSEYLEGDIWAMAGASEAHVTIALNLAVLLREQLKGSPCRVYLTDMKVKVETANAFFYPDVFVSCEPREQHNSLYKQQPVFIAEVLSPSTEAFDRGKKFAYYRQLDSLQHYWLIDSQSMAVDCFTRGSDGDWILHTANEPEQVLTLDKLPGQYAVQAIYDDVVFEDLTD